MRISQALLLTALGGILADAVTASVPGFDINTAGSVIFFVGLLWLAIETWLELSRARAAHPRPVRPARPAAPPPPPPARAAPARTYDPVVGRPAAAPPPEDPAEARTRVVRRAPR